MKLALLLTLFSSLALASPVDVRITRPDGQGHDFTSIHHAQSKKPLGNGPQTAVEGELEAMHSDDFAGKGKSEYHYAVKDAQGKRTALNIDSLPRDIHRAKVKVTGKRGAKGHPLDPAMEGLDPTQITVIQGPVSALGSGWTGSVPVLFAFIQYNGAPSNNPTFGGSAQAQAVVDQVVNHFAAGSYGLVNIRPTITSLVNVNWSSSTGNSCDLNVIYSAANPALKAAGWDPALFRDTVYVMPQNSCGWKGLGSIGSCCAFVSGTENFYLMTAVHEMGHNFGNMHAGAGGGLPGSMWGMGEYADPYSCMGNNASCGAYNAEQKRRIGWLSGLQTATYTVGSGTKSYTLAPNEKSGGQLYQVLAPTGNAQITYSVEYRASLDRLQIHLVQPFTQDALAGGDDTVLLSEHMLALGESVTLPGGVTATFSSPATTTTIPPSLITNGGFETPPTAGVVYAPTGVTGWAFAGNSGIQKNGSQWGAPAATDGVQTAFIQVGGTISQAITLNAGSYTVSFQAAMRTCCDQPFGNPVAVKLDGALIGTANPGSGFQAFSFPITIGSTGSHTLTFSGTVTNRDVSTFVDSVVLQ